MIICVFHAFNSPSSYHFTQNSKAILDMISHSYGLKSHEYLWVYFFTEIYYYPVLSKLTNCAPLIFHPFLVCICINFASVKMHLETWKDIPWEDSAFYWPLSWFVGRIRSLLKFRVSIWLKWFFFLSFYIIAQQWVVGVIKFFFFKNTHFQIFPPITRWGDLKECYGDIWKMSALPQSKLSSFPLEDGLQPM